MSSPIKSSTQLEQVSQFSRSHRIEAMREFATAISFDVTDMVTVMQYKAGCVRKALVENSSNESILKDLEKIQVTLERMGKLAKGMRSLGLSGESEELQSITLKELISKIVTLSQSWFDAQNIKFECETVPNVSLRCRPTQVSQALINLLNNAIETTLTLTEKKVTLGFTLEGKSPVRLKISVSDPGKISATLNEKILEPFYSTKPPGKGMGLGLNIVKSIAEAHSGKFYNDTSSPHTRMVFEIPVSSLQ